MKVDMPLKKGTKTHKIEKISVHNSNTFRLYNCSVIVMLHSHMWNRHIHTCTQNVHNVHNAHIDNIGIPKHEKHLRLPSSGTKLFITFWVKRFFDMRKRGTIFLCWLFHLPLTTTTTGTPDARPRRASESQPSSSDVFSNLSPRFRCVTSLTSPIWDFYCDISELHVHSVRAREHLHSCLHLTNPCAKRKVLSLTKLKGKIYKTKSLGHYITVISSTFLANFSKLVHSKCHQA